MTDCRIHCEVAAKLNFAAHQSAFPVLRELRVENLDARERIDDLVLALHASPAFLREKQWPVDRIEPEGLVTIGDRDLEVDGGFLLGLTESVRGAVGLRLERNGETLAELSKPVELLAYNEWGGAGFMPELLAAFSTPNDPAIDRILRNASEVLRRSGKVAQIDGYRSRSRQRVWEIASAIYTAICNLGLTYALPPSSFERDGQKIRLPGQMLDGRVGTCLDTAMLFTAAFEQAGLNPVVALPRGHALAGVWLQPEGLATVVVDEAEILRKRIALDELLLVETTCVTQPPAPSFSAALKAARDSILLENDHTFEAAVDVRQARAHRITPLGSRSMRPAPDGEASFPVVEQTLEEAPALPDFDTADPEEEKSQTPEGRLERWQRKLLDLSIRNPLLNHRATKASLPIICPNPGLLEDKLAEGAPIRILSVPDSFAPGQDEELHRQRTGEVITEEYARDALDTKPPRVLVDLPRQELDDRTVDIYRRARTALQEGGANTLYLALGFLLWKRNEKDGRHFRAPLILLPISLERKSVRSGIRMIAHDDEPRFNTTLLEMLRKDFAIDVKGLDEDLPRDESGIDVSGVWSTVRRAVKEAPGFEVVEGVVLGHFSFAKYLMWKDLVDRTDQLRENGVVRHLIDTPRDPYTTGIEFVEASSLDHEFDPSDLLMPLPADSSQTAAVATADRGKDFVIIGPPGTGKSQTISNLIAHLLGKEKTVLFVSEKTAALEVVQRRLKDAGLGRFCLELHSNKARKVDVLNQLRAAWGTDGSDPDADWRGRARALRTLRDRLNRVVDRLHRKRRNGLTAHHAIGVKVRDEEAAGRLTLDWPSAEQHDERTLEAMRDAVENLSVQARAVGDLSSSPFHLVAHSDWTPQWESRVTEGAGRLSAAASKAEDACGKLCEAIGIALPARSLLRLEALGELAGLLVDSYRKPTAYALEADGAERIEALEEAAVRLNAYGEARSSLGGPYDPLAWRALDGEDIGRRWAAAAEAWWPKRFFAKRSVLKEMRANGALGKPDPARDAPALARLRREGEAIDRLDRQLSGFQDWAGHATAPTVAESLRDLGERARSATGKLADDLGALAEMRAKVRQVLKDGNDLLAPEGFVRRAATIFLDALEGLRLTITGFEAIAGASLRETFASSDRAMEQLRETADTITQRRRELRDWCAWRRRRGEAIDADLLPVVEAVEQGRIPPEEIERTFEAAYCAWWSSAIMGEDEVLRTFSTPEHEADIGKFREADERYQETTARYVAARLAGKLPKQDDVRRSSHWGVIRHELNKQRRHKPVRRLLEEAPDAMTGLAPCFMMSPLSVAQYLPPERALFDVVIFDEASQITVWDAIGSIARGRQVVVAGDPRQMPPTNFFARSDDDDPDGDVDVEGDLESILDEVCAAGIPEQTLNLHYRSRKESLIAFSNARYYESRLTTFPAPDTASRGVSLVRPEGFYARGGARHNEGEAKAIVAEVVRRLTHPDPETRQRTIGVVTFNSEQQTLIENLLDRERLNRPEIEPAFSDEHTIEPVFVKNLETVQGDERDVILFSVTYGPDRNGRVTMNFGPLNREGGERRLNVALTRARREMTVFSVLHPDQMDLSRTRAQAVADLKHFLVYAERGPSALASAVSRPAEDFESPFEAAVARALRMKGWRVDPQVGVSAYRVDLGIVHPDTPGRYLAGVECDGAMYHSSAVARERDKIRQQVLEGLGWKLFRIWSTDWWTDKARALDAIHEKLCGHLEEERRDRIEREESEPEAEAGVRREAQSESALESSPAAPDEGFTPAVPSVTTPGKGEDAAGDDRDPPAARTGRIIEDDRLDRVPGSGEVESIHADGGLYAAALFDEPGLEPDPGAFYEREYESRLGAMLDHVIDTEGPIHENVLVQRIARHHGFRRSGKRIRDIVTGLAERRRSRTHETAGCFFWPGSGGERAAPARYQGRGDELRKIEHVCREEIRAIDEALSSEGDADRIARAMGISRLGRSARRRIEEALSEACRDDG